MELKRRNIIEMLLAEFKHRKKRIFGAIISFAIGITLLLTIDSLSSGFKILAGKPMEKIGCNITVQRSGNVPEKMEGAVFPCAAVTIKKSEISKIISYKPIVSLSKAILLWVFDAENFQSVLGIEPDTQIGPGLLKNHMIEGRFLYASQFETIVDKTYAESRGINVGSKVKLTKFEFEVVGIVDASKLGKLTLANFYIPLSLASIIAIDSKSIQDISPFQEGDATILFIHIQQDYLKQADIKLKGILGEKATISSPISFYERFQGIVKFFTKFSNFLSVLVVIVAVFITSLTILSTLNLKKHEIGILKAIGWTPPEVSKLLIKETFFICFLGGILGIIGAYIVINLLKLVTVNIPIPWEMSSSTPHFLMKNPDERITMAINLPISISWILSSSALIGSCIIGAIMGYFTGVKVNKIKPVEAIRNV